MRFKHLIIIAILALLPLSAFAWGVVGISGGVAAGGAGCTGVKGNNTTTTTDFQGTALDRLYLRQVVLDCGGTPTSINARTRVYTADGSGAVFVVYDDDGTDGAPGTRLWSGANDIYDSGQSSVTTTLTDTTINYNFPSGGGTYWIGIASGTSGRLYSESTTGGTMMYSVDSYTDVFPIPPETAPSLTSGTKQLQVWLVFP